MKANSEKTKQSKKATRRVLAGVLCGASVLSLVLSLVMPPISQVIANDVQTVSAEETVMGGGSSSESTDVENTTNGDAENQNSDETEGGESGDDAQLEGQSEEEQQNEGATTSDDKTVVAAAENEQTGAAAEGIDEASELKNKLESVAENQSGSFQLMKDLDCNEEIILNKSGSNITLDLNGFKIKYSSNNNNKSLFNVSNSAEFTITDSRPGKDNIAGSQPLQDQDHNLIADNCGKTAKMLYEKDVPTELTYYVTESSVDTKDSTRTNETTYEHKVTIKGAIVACSSSKVNLIKLNGGTFNLQGGVLTQKNNCNVDGLIYAQNGSVNMSGGYVCGASMGRDGAGAGIHVDGSTLVISGGVIAGNYAPSGGGVYAMNSTVNMVGGIISGNGTNSYQRGYGAGICAVDSMVTITNGHITNNKYQFYQDAESDWGHLGFGCHGGGGIAAFSSTQGQKKGGLVISGGYITGNYSAEAGGGVYAGAWNQALSEFTFSGGIIASNVAQNSEGGGIRIAAPTVGVFNVSDTKAYITNNTTNTTNDWGGGGVFVQGSSVNNVKPAGLEINNALITNNHANGFGGGFAACPTGKTAITDTNGIAIFGNSDGKSDGNGYNRSGGTNGKNDDADKLPDGGGGEITEDFKNAGHQDLFLIRDSTNPESLPYIAAVTGQMLGGGAAKWTGTIDGKPKTISKYDGAQAKYMIGLRSDSFVDDQNVAIGLASLYITGNKSNIHGGGIMTNGDVVAGSTTEVKVYPKMKLNGTKELTGRALDAGEFKFQLLKPGKGGKAPSFNDGKLQLNDCSVVDTVENDKKGYFTFDLGEVYADDALVYYLVEVPGTDKDKGVAYDETIYKIDPTVVEDAGKSHDVLGIEYKYYKVESVSVTRVENDGAGARTPETESAAIAAAEGENAATITLTKGATFTNTYTSSGSWTPQVTKKVVGGEMKKFKFELYAENSDNTETPPQTKYTSAESGNPQTVTFDPVQIGPLGIKDLTNGKATFTYYIRECDASKVDGTKHEGYKNDTKKFKVVVTATDKGDGTLECTPTYYEVDANDVERETDNPTFTNTYSTSLPLSGMSGVTLTYLAGAAVLCAAAAWMHIRRKANAKGGERRE